jgi:hypothetical protein
MLNIQNTRQIDVPGQGAFTAYGDDADPGAWYIPPRAVWAVDSTGLPQFALVKYKLPDGKVAGFCRFSVQLAIDPAQQAALKQQIPGAAQPQFDWVKSGASFTYTVDGKSTTIASQPSNFGSQLVTFSVPLPDENHVNAFINAFSPGGSRGGTFGVGYDLAANTRLPAVTVVTTFNSSIAYQYQVENRSRLQRDYHTDTWGNTSVTETLVFVGQYVHELLQQTQAGNVQVTPGTGLSPTMLQMVTQWANVQLRKDVEEAVNTALSLIRNPSDNFSMNSVASFTHTLSTSNVVPWYFNVDATLQPLSADVWQKVYSEVSQQQLDVAFNMQADMARLGVEHVNLELRYGDTLKSFTFDSKSPTWAVTLPGQVQGSQFDGTYQYRYTVVYGTPTEGTALPNLSTDWIAGEGPAVNFTAVELGLMPVTFEATNVNWGSGPNDVKEIRVEWNWIPNSGPILTESFVLNQTTSSQVRTLRSAMPVQNQAYRYALTFTMGDNKTLHAAPRTDTKSLQSIDNPLAQITFGVFCMLPDDTKAVLLNATFDDAINDIHENKQWKVLSEGDPSASTFNDWTFMAVAANLNAATAVFSGTWIDKNNKQHTIPKTLVTSNVSTFIVSADTKVVTAVVNAQNVKPVEAGCDGVFQVEARVSYSTSPTSGAAGTNLQTLTFNRQSTDVQYYTTDSIDIDSTPTFMYQYVYTVNRDNGAHNDVIFAWSSPQSTQSTALPVIAGMPPSPAPQHSGSLAGYVTQELLAAPDGMDPRTQALFDRHEAFCASAEGVDSIA